MQPHRPRHSVRSWVVVLAAIVAPLMLAGTGAALLSKAMWGYCFTRPGVDWRVRQAQRVISMTGVIVEVRPDGSREFVPGGKWADWYQGPGWYQQRGTQRSPEVRDYYLLERRPLVALEETGAIAAPVPSLDAQRLAGLLPLLMRWPGVAAQAGPGYDQFRTGQRGEGIIYELVGRPTSGIS